MSNKITFTGTKELAALMRKRKMTLEQKRGMFKAAAIQVERWTLKNFNADGGLHKESKLKWKPLSPATISNRRKGKGRGTPQILRDTGRLRGAFEIQATNKRGMVINRTKYAHAHEFGNPNHKAWGKKRVPLPQRKMFPTQAHGNEIVMPVFKAFIEKVVKG